MPVWGARAAFRMRYGRTQIAADLLHWRKSRNRAKTVRSLQRLVSTDKCKAVRSDNPSKPLYGRLFRIGAIITASLTLRTGKHPTENSHTENNHTENNQHRKQLIVDKNPDVPIIGLVTGLSGRNDATAAEFRKFPVIFAVLREFVHALVLHVARAKAATVVQFDCDASSAVPTSPNHASRETFSHLFRAGARHCAGDLIGAHLTTHRATRLG